MDKQFDCPECGSDKIQKAKILYETGASAIKMTTGGIGVTGGGSVGVGLAATTGSSQSELSKNLSPPGRPKQNSAGVVFLLLGIGTILMVLFVKGEMPPTVGVTITFLVIGVGLTSLGGLLIQKSGKTFGEKEAKYKEDYAKWERLWFCNRCGHTFYIE